MVERSQRNSLPLPLLSCVSWMFMKENPDRKKIWIVRLVLFVAILCYFIPWSCYVMWSNPKQNNMIQQILSRKLLFFFFFVWATCIVECIRLYILNFKIKTNITSRQIAKETKEKKIICAENVTGYDNFVCEFAFCTFNLLNRVMNFSWLFIRI